MKNINRQVELPTEDINILDLPVLQDADRMMCANSTSAGYMAVGDMAKIIGKEVQAEIAKGKGLFSTEEELKKAIPSPKVGDWAIVGNTIPGRIWVCAEDGVWADSGQTGGSVDIPTGDYAELENITSITDILS